MFVLKALTMVIAGLLAYVAVNRFMGQLQAAKVRARVTPQQQRQPVKRLRQDPRTGVYYPEE